MKICNKCLIGLDESCFSVNKSTLDKLSNKCRKCLSEQRRSARKEKKKLEPPKKETDYFNKSSKLCKECDQNLEIDKFNICTLTLDGREGVCKKCRALKRKKNALNSQNYPEKTEKKCSKCKKILPTFYFSKDVSRDDGYSTICKFCKNFSYKIYMNSSKAKEISTLKSKRWKFKNPDSSKIYYQNNKEKFKQKYLNYRNSPMGRYISIKIQANQRNIDFNLTKDFVNQFWDANCHYCESKLDIPRFDRINSNLGYMENNVVPCCQTCNYMKNHLTKVDFYNHLLKIIKFQKDGAIVDGFPQIIYSGNPKNDHYLSPLGRFNWYQSQAKIRKIPFKIEYGSFIKYWQKSCSYCGSVINTIGLDRINNNLGYIEGNINSCCKICNSMKAEMSFDHFISKCENILKNNKD
jgi:hypothetical protein